jgi:hypothetical protein
MAITVNAAFETFMRDYVRLDPKRTELARNSKGNLVSEIEKFPNDGEFFMMYPGFSNIDYGSFSRKTKIRELDDIDLMIVLHAEGNWREVSGDGFKIRCTEGGDRQLSSCNVDSNILNSIKVVNKFKDYLWRVSAYEKADIKRNQEAATLKLNSYEWIYDIVPCFMTNPDSAGKTFFLIPDGKGDWKPTDPRIDKERTSSINQGQTVSVLDMIRIMKYWTKRPTMPTMKSYYLENLILDYYGAPNTNSTMYIDVELPNLLAIVYNKVHQPLNDPKGYQGDINHLSWEERKTVQARAKLDYERANEARKFETDGKQKESIQKWGEIFGPAFPIYTS